MVFSSWQKTLITRWPPTISSIKPFTSAMDRCWRTKYLPLWPESRFATSIITTA